MSNHTYAALRGGNKEGVIMGWRDWVFNEQEEIEKGKRAARLLAKVFHLDHTEKCKAERTRLAAEGKPVKGEDDCPDANCPWAK